MPSFTPAGCPGKDPRFLTVVDLSCPRCGYAIEFFSDESARTCPGCGECVPRMPSSTCADWCSAARECEALRAVERAND